MMHHCPKDDKENADPRGGQHGKSFPNSRPLSPGKRKRTPEEKLARPPLRDITGAPGISPTFVLEPPAFAIAADVDTTAAATTDTNTTKHGSKKKAAVAAKASSSSSGGDTKPGKKPGAGGAGAGGGSMLSGQPLRPLR